ncbi:hypothetical protein [Bacillus sp. ISL-46]|uniref:hypothetical protein n=1 Tax=Bacillus sp. ISL-46 TaxID=2819129 RepID=UPI001BE5DAED|nr:hypothetical protein [Bacillus sp. ISL-46]MBT2723042.1 hypothetical protein [Bacillus sp. ISL-46]
MKQVYRFNEKGHYVEPVMIQDGQKLPFDCTEKELPQPNWKPIFNGVEWVETATEEEMNPPVSLQPNVEEQLVQMEQDVADLWYSVMMGGIA